MGPGEGQDVGVCQGWAASEWWGFSLQASTLPFLPIHPTAGGGGIPTGCGKWLGPGRADTSRLSLVLHHLL